MADSVNLHALILDALGWTEFPKDDDFMFEGEPEPCDECNDGLCNVFTYEKRRLCRRCMLDHIVEMGWDKLPQLELATPEIVETNVELPAEPQEEDASGGVRPEGEGSPGQGELF
jgi:hypothetical protein